MTMEEIQRYMNSVLADRREAEKQTTKIEMMQEDLAQAFDYFTRKLGKPVNIENYKILLDGVQDSKKFPMSISAGMLREFTTMKERAETRLKESRAKIHELSKNYTRKQLLEMSAEVYELELTAFKKKVADFKKKIEKGYAGMGKSLELAEHYCTEYQDILNELKTELNEK